jgi:iron complex outermembrane receptor protein
MTTRASLTGGHVLGRWTRALSTRTDFAAQAYYDRTNRGEALLDEKRDTGDADVQVHLRLGRSHDLVGGLGYRVSSDHIKNGIVVALSRTHRRDGLFSAFIQDEITLVPNRLRLTGGTKLEHNSYTSWELQPDIRAILLLDRNQELWGAVSRAVRTPSRAESDVLITTTPVPGPGGLPLVTSLLGNLGFESETLRAHEIGYRIQPDSHVSLDVAAFYNLYDHLRTFEPGSPRLQLTPSGPQLMVPVLFGNLMEGNTHGLELTANVKPTPGWRIDATYSYLHLALTHKTGSRDTLGLLSEDNSPRHQARLHSTVTFGGRFDADASIGRVGDLTRDVGAYTRVDGRLGWNVTGPLTLAVGVRNLLDSEHVEFTSTLGEVPTRVRRSVFANVNWRF